MRFYQTETYLDGMGAFMGGLQRVLEQNGHSPVSGSEHADVVLHPFNAEAPKPTRRGGRGTFVISVARRVGGEESIDKLYPLLVRSLSNLLLVITSEEPARVHLVTPEQGHVVIKGERLDQALFDNIYKRIEPQATSRLVIENIFEPNLEEELWNGDDKTASIGRAGKFLASMNLLPAPFPIDQMLSPREMRHLKLVYGIGGLSYGNFSARLDKNRFWMSASGVDKSNLVEIGRDILLVTGYDEERNAMRLSVPPNVEPRRVSVDAIEHWMIYQEHPEVGAILHAHAWIDGAVSTEMTYPCGTYELGAAVADIVRESSDPAHAVVGLKNHGLTLTGETLDEILERVGGQMVPNVPMT